MLKKQRRVRTSKTTKSGGIITRITIKFPKDTVPWGPLGYNRKYLTYHDKLFKGYSLQASPAKLDHAHRHRQCYFLRCCKWYKRTRQTGKGSTFWNT